jgi:hypothetical protein
MNNPKSRKKAVRTINEEVATHPPDRQSVENTTGDMVIDYLIKMGYPLTVKNYLHVSYMGDASCLDDLEGENRAEVEDLIERGLLVDTDTDYLA